MGQDFVDIVHIVFMKILRESYILNKPFYKQGQTVHKTAINGEREI